MVRPKRIDLPFALYHVFSRTNSGDTAFTDGKDRDKFLEYLAKYGDIFSFKIQAWCLMPNHFHLILESTSRPALSELMRRLLTAYTVYFNRRHSRHGHLFQGRFKSFLVDKTDYLLALSWYVHNNPARMTPPLEPEKYEGSSLRYYIHGSEPPYLNTQEVLVWFEGDRKRYAEFMKKGLDEETKPRILQQRYIGGEAFVSRMNERLGLLGQSDSRASRGRAKREQANIDRERDQAEKILKAVAEYFKCEHQKIINGYYSRGDVGKARTVIIGLLRDCLPWTNNQVAEYLGLKQKGGIYYHLDQIKKSRDLTRAFEAIGKELIHKH